MALALFDLDNTLIAGDSDLLWGQFLGERGLVDAAAHNRENERFFHDYRDGTLDIHAYLRFQLKFLADHAADHLYDWRAAFIDEKIKPILLPKAEPLLAQHRLAGDTLVIITATNRFVTAPIAELLAVPHLIATEPEFCAGRYTGQVSGTPSFAGGKVERLREWLRLHPHDLSDSWFYTDSHNDLPLLGIVANPVAVDPDQVLGSEARKNRWPVISLR